MWDWILCLEDPEIHILLIRGCVPREQTVVAWVKNGLGCVCVLLDQVMTLVQFQLQYARLDQSFGCSWFLANISVLLLLAQSLGLSFSLISTFHYRTAGKNARCAAKMLLGSAF